MISEMLLELMLCFVKDFMAYTCPPGNFPFVRTNIPNSPSPKLSMNWKLSNDTIMMYYLHK